MLKKWTRLSSEVFHENKWWRGVHDRFRLPNGKEGDYFYMSKLDPVAIVAVDSDGKILMHKQYRYLFDKESLEFPCGSSKSGQTIEEAAVAELTEETGFRPRKLKKIGQFSTANALMTETCHVFLANELEPFQAEKDETEDFQSFKLTQEEIDSAIASREIWCGFTIAAWNIAKPYLKTALQPLLL